MHMNRRTLLQRSLLASPMLLSSVCRAESGLGGSFFSDPNESIQWGPERKVSDNYSSVSQYFFVTAHAPSIASDGTTLYAAYCGDGGSNLYLTTRPLPTDSSWKWSGGGAVEAQVVAFGKAAKVSGSPFCMLYNGFKVILSADDDRKNVTCYFLDSNWASITVPFSGGPNHNFSSPRAVVLGGILHVFVTDNQKSGSVTRYCRCTGRMSENGAWNASPTAGPYVFDSVGALNAVTVAGHTPSQGGVEVEGTLGLTNNPASFTESLRTLEFSGNSPHTNDDGAALFPYKGSFGYVYRAAKGNQLFYALPDPGGSSSGPLQLLPSIEIPGKSSELPGVVVAGNVIHLLYKGESTHDLYSLRGTF